MKGVPLNEELYNYIVNTFAEEDEVLKNIVIETGEKNFPLIQVSPELGKFLYLLIKLINARKVLEIGTLAGYSAIWMARALPQDGRLITLEISREHADFATGNFAKAGLENKIELLRGNAVDLMKNLKEEKFDFVFMDADKTQYTEYFNLVIQMTNPGGIIAADNTLKHGRVIDSNPDKYTKGILAYNKLTAHDRRVESLLVPISDGVTISLVK